MLRSLFLFLSLLISVTTAYAQTFTFRHRTQQLEGSISVGQRVKVFARDTAGSLTTHKGRLDDIRNDSLFIHSKKQKLSFSMANVEEISYHSPFMEKFTRICLFAGIALLVVVSIGMFIYLFSGAAALETLGMVAVSVGTVLLLLAPVLSIFTRKWFANPATAWTIELAQAVGGNVP